MVVILAFVAKRERGVDATDPDEEAENYRPVDLKDPEARRENRRRRRRQRRREDAQQQQARRAEDPPTTASATGPLLSPQESPRYLEDSEDPVPVGLLLSLSGPLSLQEQPLHDMALMAIAEINDRGGVLGGRKVIPHVRDADSNWHIFSEQAEDLLKTDKVAAIFGGFTSASRRAALSKVEPLNGLLFYPASYEGEESSFHVFYTGSIPNQHALLAATYLLSPEGGAYRRFVLLGTDTVFPRTTQRTLRHFLKDQGILPEAIAEYFTPVDHMDYRDVVQEIKRFAAGQRVVVIATLEGDSNMFFFRELRDQGLRPSTLPVLSLALDEESLQTMEAEPMVEHLVAGSYFMSLEDEQNRAFISRWKDFLAFQDQERNANQALLTHPINAAMEAIYCAVHLWAQAVEQAGTADVDAVRQALTGQRMQAPSGYVVTVDGSNHHLSKPLFIGRIRSDAGIDVIWRSQTAITPTPYSAYVPETRGLIADWTYPYVCSNCDKPRYGATP